MPSPGCSFEALCAPGVSGTRASWRGAGDSEDRVRSGSSVKLKKQTDQRAISKFKMRLPKPKSCWSMNFWRCFLFASQISCQCPPSSHLLSLPSLITRSSLSAPTTSAVLCVFVLGIASTAAVFLSGGTFIPLLWRLALRLGRGPSGTTLRCVRVAGDPARSAGICGFHLARDTSQLACLGPTRCRLGRALWLQLPRLMLEPPSAPGDERHGRLEH